MGKKFVVQVYLTESDEKFIKNEAEKLGLSMSSFLKMNALKNRFVKKEVSKV